MKELIVSAANNVNLEEMDTLVDVFLVESLNK